MTVTPSQGWQGDGECSDFWGPVRHKYSTNMMLKSTKHCHGTHNPAGPQAWSSPPSQEYGGYYEWEDLTPEWGWPYSNVHHAPRVEDKCHLRAKPFKFIFQILGCKFKLCHLPALGSWAFHSLTEQLLSLSEKWGASSLLQWEVVWCYSTSKCLQPRCPEWVHIPFLPLLPTPHAPAQTSLPTSELLPSSYTGESLGNFWKVEMLGSDVRPMASEPLVMEPSESFFLKLPRWCCCAVTGENHHSGC